MSFLFGSTKVPKIPSVSPPVAPPPIPPEKDIEDEEKKKLTQGRKKRSTILTSGLGVLTPAKVGTKTLLGQ